MKPMYIVPLLVCSLVACAAEQDIAQVVMEEPADVLAGALPPPIAGPNQSAELLPATMTNKEATALAKADGYDPRDNHPLYAFTSKPGDVSYMPGEFSTPQALLVGWSSSGSGFKSMFAEIIAEASHEVPTTMIYVSSNTAANSLYNTLQQYGADTSTIHFAKLSLDSIWIRDYGPLVTRTTSGGYRVIDTRYYYGRWQDDVVPTQLASAWGLPASRPPIEMEGGNFQSDGAGTCITTTATLQQNGYTSSQVKQVYKDYLGCSTTLILPRLSGEGTGHVDMYVTIVGAKKAIVGQYSTYDDPTNAKVVDQGAQMLQNAGFKVYRIPMPGNWDGAYRSYTNSLAVGDRVLVPVYSDDTRYQSAALSVFKQAYPGRTIVPIDSTDVIQWAGAIHCVTMTIGS